MELYQVHNVDTLPGVGAYQGHQPVEAVAPVREERLEAGQKLYQKRRPYLLATGWRSCCIR